MSIVYCTFYWFDCHWLPVVCCFKWIEDQYQMFCWSTVSSTFPLLCSTCIFHFFWIIQNDCLNLVRQPPILRWWASFPLCSPTNPLCYETDSISWTKCKSTFIKHIMILIGGQRGKSSLPGDLLQLWVCCIDSPGLWRKYTTLLKLHKRRETHHN